MSIEAMKLALEALEAVSMEMTVGERYTNAGQQVLDAIDLLRVALSQQPDTGEPFGYIHHFAAHDESGALIDTTWEADGCADPLPHPTFPSMWKWTHCTPFYTTQQPTQAAQAEVTDGIRPEDFTVDVVVKSMGGFAQINTKGVRVTHKPTGVSVACDAARSQHTNRHQAFETLRTILAQRHERVPMTDEQISLEAHNADDRDWNDLRFRSSWHEGFLEGARFAEAHHGIKPKEQA